MTEVLDNGLGVDLRGALTRLPRAPWGVQGWGSDYDVVDATGRPILFGLTETVALDLVTISEAAASVPDVDAMQAKIDELKRDVTELENDKNEAHDACGQAQNDERKTQAKLTNLIDAIRDACDALVAGNPVLPVRDALLSAVLKAQR